MTLVPPTSYFLAHVKVLKRVVSYEPVYLENGKVQLEDEAMTESLHCDMNCSPKKTNTLADLARFRARISVVRGKAP